MRYTARVLALSLMWTATPSLASERDATVMERERVTEHLKKMGYTRISDVDVVQEKIDRWLEENDDLTYRQEDINDIIAEMVSSIQWIANEHPLKSFRRRSVS